MEDLSHPPENNPAKEQINYPIVNMAVNMINPFLIPILSIKYPPNNLIYYFTYK